MVAYLQTKDESRNIHLCVPYPLKQPTPSMLLTEDKKVEVGKKYNIIIIIASKSSF